jgi:acyl dehydratase
MAADTVLSVDLSDFFAYCRADLPQPEQNNYDVSRDNIRKVAYAIADPNALYLDEEFARQTCWGGVIAQPGYLYSHGRQMHSWPCSLGRIVDSEGYEYDLGDNMGDDWDLLLPVRPGDTVRSHSRPMDAVAKRGGRLGSFVLATSESRFTNQRGELVAVMHGRSARWSGARQHERGALGSVYPPLPAGQTTRNVAGALFAPDRARRYDRHDVYFEDTFEGMEIPERIIGPLDTAQTARWRMHIADMVWPEAGSPLVSEGHVPDYYAGGHMRIAWFGSLLMQWAGPNAWVRKVNWRNREWILVGFRYACRARITRKYKEDGHYYVECDLRIEQDELGILCNTGTAVVELMSRSA